MNNLNEYTVKGMHCAACKTLIEMELDEAGLDGVAVDSEKQTLLIPETLLPQLSTISDVVASAGDYTLLQNP